MRQVTTFLTFQDAEAVISFLDQELEVSSMARMGAKGRGKGALCMRPSA
jgi:hypothetical protein